ncbi:hypothetical protein IJ21_22630 [Paenibacillus sp. 32O-W]|uniref:DUF58 domain-containing protein n=1 Tax=Paenibacillus sp. 32O-W TaxID=1695218 RepID=UPI000721E207|nr:DUF58 domain-containing protein [Paenibacillus sp. 32O-W]ALS27660.1 hypothetical protein IJ21_22630 [Paenibacillus sp. 32O-W]
MSGGERETGLERLFPDMSVLYRLERMSLPAKGRFRGTMQGKRRSRAFGSSLEFADYRPYAPGDDIRRIDWNVYGRTGRAFVRQYWDEQELSVCLYIDVSTSMRFGEESGRKLDYALRLAACVGYAALAGDDRVAVRLFADGIVRELPMCRGRGAAHRLFRFLDGALRGDFEGEAGAAGGSDLYAAFRHPSALPGRSGQTWLFTDGLHESGLEDTIRALLAAGQDVVYVQLLSPAEIDPQLTGELRLIDSETGTGKEVAIGGSVVASYRQAVRQHCETIRRYCEERGVAYLFADTGRPIADTVLRSFREAGLLRG